MKLLSNDQQIELQQLFESLSGLAAGMTIEQLNQIGYWSIEMKPKRARRKNIETVQPVLDAHIDVV